jgi:hypothetical protein
MRNRSRLLAAAITAALALTLGVATANASRSFSISSNTLLTYVSTGLTFTDSFQFFICAVTLTASLHATAPKIRGSLIGFVNGANFGTCFTPLVEHRNPWHVTYNSFRGTLPRITEVLITVNRVRLLRSGPFESWGCLYEGDMGLETNGTTGASEYRIQHLVPQRENVFSLVDSTLNAALTECAQEIVYIGTFLATLPPVLRLI